MDRAGQETFLMNVYRHIDRTQVQFVFLCTSPQKGDYDDEIRALGGAIYVLPEVRSTGKIGKYLDQIRVLTRWLKEHRNVFDTVHLHTYHAMDVWVHLEACRRAGVKNRIVHSHNTSGMHQTLHRIMRQVNKLYRFEKYACSADAGEWLFGKSAVRKNRVEIVYNAIEWERYAFDPIAAQKYRQELGVSDRIVIGHIGRFNYQKNHAFLLEVFSVFHQKHPDSVLELIGKGELQQQIADKANELGIRDSILFLGTRDDIPQLLSGMDVFVFPSLFEGLALVLVEAQAAALPVVTTDNIPQEAIVSDHVRQLPAKDPKAWANAIESLLNLPREEVVYSAGKEHFAIDRVAQKLQANYLCMNKR